MVARRSQAPELPRTARARYQCAGVSELHDIIVVSDLHLGRGKNPRTGRYYRLEAFFFDDDFHHFCAHLIEDARRRQTPFKLVFNGDTFDLLRIDHDPLPTEKRRERRYGPALTPGIAAETMRQILAGHPTFVEALAAVLAAGNPIVFLPGNHDIEVQWRPVQLEIRAAVERAVREQAGEAAAATAAELLTFERWFHHEPGRIWIEHGCQYDPENAFRYYLRGKLADQPDAVHKAEIDVPLGTFFQRYLYNQFGNITFIVPSSRSNLRYFRWLILNRPRLLARLITVHLPFFLQVLRRIAKAGTKADELRENHRRELGELAQSSGLGEDLGIIESFKQVHKSSALLARDVIGRLIKISGFALLGALLVIVLWTVGVQSISATAFGLGGKAILMLAMNFLFLIVAIAVVMYFLLRPSEQRPDLGLPRAAEKIAPLLGVPIVTFGHTHDEEIAAIPIDRNGTSWYFNTGTWIAVFTADTLLPRERVQYTFLRVRGTEGELLHWSPGRGEATPVVLIE